MNKFNLPCPQNNDRECEHCHGVNAQDGWRFRGCFFPPNKGKYVAYIKECPLKAQKGEIAMTQEEKFSKAIKLADAMYYAAQQLTTDASHLNKAMKDWWQFKNVELNKE